MRSRQRCLTNHYPQTLHFSDLPADVPPPFQGLEKLKEVRATSDVTFWLWLMYPPPRNGKVEISGQCDIFVLADVPTPRNGKVEIPGQCDILVLADVPPPGMEKLKSQVNVTFWFWQMYPPPRNGKLEISGQCDILVLADIPPTPRNWTKHECYRTKPFQERSTSTFYNLTPLPLPLSDSIAEQETGEFQFQMDMDRWTQTPSATPLQPKNEMLIFGLHSTSDDWPGWLMDSNPIRHPSPAKKMKCSFLDYVQLLMIGQAG